MDALTAPNPYPDPPNCCEHSANAHSRKHCLLCDCEKAPQVSRAAAPPEPEGETVGLRPCGHCHAAVPDTPEDVEGHLDWHERQLGSLEVLMAAVWSLTTGQPVDLSALGSVRPRTTPPTTEDPQ